MRLEFLNTSVVVNAQDHNPTILHPSFLVANKIIPESWELAEPSISTPAMSVAVYKEGIKFIVEDHKLQVMQESLPDQICDSDVADYANAYIEKLPHVNYKAVGINLEAILYNSDPSKYLIDRFLSVGNWNDGELSLKGFSLSFVYSSDYGDLKISCEPGTLTRISEKIEKRGIILNANYHNNLTSGDPLNEAIGIISNCSSRFDHFSKLIKKIFEIEE